MTPIVLYLRVSTLDQDVTSQSDDLKKWAQSKGFKIEKIFGETVSGYDVNAQRKQYDLMKKYILDKNIKNIAVWEISRLSRSLITTINELDFYTKNGVNVHFRKEGIESLSNNVTNQLLLTILSSMAQMERDSFIERGNRGRMTAVMKGRMIGYSKAPYGYTSDENGILCINPKEAEAVKLMYDLIIKGNTLYNVAQQLNAKQIPTRSETLGKKKDFKGNKIDFLWSPHTVKRIIARTINKGVRNFKGNIISTPIIVSPEIWEKANKSFENNIGYRNRTKYEYLFKSLMKCGKCDRHIVTYKATSSKYSYYLCTANINKYEKCSLGYITQNIIDNNLYKVIFDYKHIGQIMSLGGDERAQGDSKQKEIDYYNSQIEINHTKQTRLKKLYTSGYISIEEFEKDFNSIKNEIVDISNKIIILKNDIKTLSKTDVNQIIQKYKDEKNFNIKRDIIVKCVNKINLYRIDVANVDWKKPLQQNEKIIYVEIYIFNYNYPIKVLLTPYSKNVLISNNLQYLPDYNMVVDIKRG